MAELVDIDLIKAAGRIGGPKFAKVDIASAGDNTVVTAVSGKKIRVISYTLVADAAVTVIIKSDTAGGAVSLTGAMSFAANGGAAAYCPNGLVETASGKALNLYLGGAVGVRGHITYVEVVG